MGECAPKNSLLAVTFDCMDEVVGEGTEQFYNLLLFVAVLIGANVNARADKDRIGTAEIFSIETVDKGMTSGLVSSR